MMVTQKTIKISTLRKFDAAEFLRDDGDIAAYLTEALEDSDPDALIDALNTIARAKGMTAIAEKSGLGRESLYKALRPGAHPRFETISKLCTAFGVKLVAMPA